ncbi:MAG: Ig-like domain-containing protein [Prevotellaceae bacterium]|jgi:hypothetical protein|nr:Ig-like domain-containing protein [Prevotellaceae bacterium]
MKTITSRFRLSLAAAIIFASVNAAQAAVLLDETFSYPADGDLKGNGNWGERGSGGAAPQLISTPLTYDGYIHSGAGKAVQTSYTSGASSFMTQDTIPSISSGVVYLSLMYRPDANQAQSQSEVIGLGTISASNYVRLWHGKNGGSGNPFGFGVTRASGTGSDIKWIAAEKNVSTGATHFLVLKYDATNKNVYLFVNPTTGTAVEPDFDVADSTNTATITSVNAIIMRQNGNSASKYTIGGLRLSTTWAEAVQSSAADTEAPTLAAATPLLPANGATGVEVSSAITATFSEPVKAGANASGIKLINATDGNAEVSASASFDGSTLIITPDALLGNSKTYHVEIPAGSVTDIAGNDFAGVSSAGWVFTTTAALSDAKELTDLTLQGQRGESIYRNDSVFIAVAPTAKMDSLKIATLITSNVATASIGGKTVEADSFVNASGGDVSITVTAQNSSTKGYTLRVSNAAATGNELLTFRINGSPNVNGVIRNDSVLVVMPANTTSLSELTAAFTCSPYASVYAVVDGGDSLQNSATTVNDFSATVTYKVVSEASVAKEYKVVVSIAPKPKGLLLEENFLYPADTKLSETAITGWRLDGAPDTAAKVSDAQLDYPSYAPVSVSQSIQMSYPAISNGSVAYYKSLPAAVSSDTIYLSFMVNTTLAQSGQGYIGFSQGTSGQRARIWFKRDKSSNNSTGVLVGVSRNSGTAANADYCTTDTLPYGSTALVALKHIFVSGDANDIVQVFINPIPGQPEPTPSVSAVNTSTGADPTLLDGIFIRANGSNALQYAVGGVRVATTWEEAVKYGEPAGAPVAETFTPASGATDAPYNTDPVVMFNKAIKAGTGSISVKKYADDATVGTYDVTDNSKVIFSGKSLTIKAAPLPKGEKLYVEIPATAVLSNANEAYTGTADKDTWAFTAPKSVAANMTSYSIASPTTPGLTYNAVFAAGYDSATITTNEALAQADINAASIGVSEFATVAIKTGSGYDPVIGNGVIVYEVTAEDGVSKQEYKIAFVSSPASNIVAYSIGDAAGKVSSPASGTYVVTISLPSSVTDVTALAATFELSPGASATVGSTPQVSGVTPNNYTDTVRYIVTASDGTFTEWKVFAAPMPVGLLLKENFDYPEGILLKNALGSGWVETQNTIADVSVADYRESYMLTDTTRLTYPYYAGAIDDNSKSLRFVYPGFSSQGATTVKTVSKVDITAGTVYYAFMLNAETVTSNSGTEIAGFTSTPTSTAGQSRVYVKRVGAGNTTHFLIGVGKNHSSIANVPAWASADAGQLACRQTHLIVLKYDFATGYASLFVNPAVGASEPATPFLRDNTISSSTAGADPVPVTSIRGISIRENGTSQPVGLKIGGIRVATTWDEAVKMAETMEDTGSDIKSYSLKAGNEDVDGYIIPDEKKIEVTIAAEHEKTGLVATFALSPQATAYVDNALQESGVTANDFDVDVVIYEVRPLKGAISYWSVSVIKENEEIPNGIGGNRLRVSVYPNPVVQNLYLQADKTLKRVEVFDISGGLLYSLSNPGNVVSFAGLGSGSYFVRLTATDGSAATAKIAK